MECLTLYHSENKPVYGHQYSFEYSICGEITQTAPDVALTTLSAVFNARYDFSLSAWRLKQTPLGFFAGVLEMGNQCLPVAFQFFIDMAAIIAHRLLDAV